MGKDALETRKSLEMMSLEKEWAAFPQTIKNPRARINVKSWLDRYCWTYCGQTQTLQIILLVVIL